MSQNEIMHGFRKNSQDRHTFVTAAGLFLAQPMDPYPRKKAPILIVDPSPDERVKIIRAFEGLGYELHEAGSSGEAQELLDEIRCRLVVCELVLPDSSGFAFCRALREHPTWKSLPVILVSHWANERDRILAFEAGADDFAPKPFFDRELTSRVRAVLRRCVDEPDTEEQDPHPFRPDERFEIRFDANEIWVDDRVVPLTPREFALVVALVERRGRVLAREDLISRAWGDLESPHFRSVDAHIKSIRRKLGLAGNAIETVRGLGYRFTDQPIRELPGESGPVTLGGPGDPPDAT